MNIEYISGVRNSKYEDGIESNLMALLSEEVRQMEDLGISGIPTIHSFRITEFDKSFLVDLEISNRSKTGKVIQMSMKVTKSQVLSYMHNELENLIRAVAWKE